MYEYRNPFKHLDPIEPARHLWVWWVLIGIVFGYLIW